MRRFEDVNSSIIISFDKIRVLVYTIICMKGCRKDFNSGKGNIQTKLTQLRLLKKF